MCQNYHDHVGGDRAGRLQSWSRDLPHRDAMVQQPCLSKGVDSQGHGTRGEITDLDLPSYQVVLQACQEPALVTLLNSIRAHR